MLEPEAELGTGRDDEGRDEATGADDAVVARALRTGCEVVDAAGAGVGNIIFDIIRFWKSTYLL